MTPLFVRRGIRLGATFAAVALVAACEDARVKAVDTGMTRDQAISQLAKESGGTGPDSMPNIYRRSEYLIDGKKYEILYFSEDNERAGRDTVDLRELVPIFLVDNKVTGKGWDYVDSAGTALKIPLPPKRD